MSTADKVPDITSVVPVWPEQSGFNELQAVQEAIAGLYLDERFEFQNHRKMDWSTLVVELTPFNGPAGGGTISASADWVR